MKIHADYTINISDPETGAARHSVYRHFTFGGRRPLSGLLRARYNAERQSARKNNQNGQGVLPFEDLDFLVNKSNCTILHFVLPRNNGWKFKSKGISFMPSPNKVGVWLEDDKNLFVRFYGSQTISGDDYKYTLHYVKPDGTSFDFDPIIRNGSDHPFLPFFFRLLTVLIPLAVGSLAVVGGLRVAGFL